VERCKEEEGMETTLLKKLIQYRIQGEKKQQSLRERVC
jgi:hypothetical protein